MYDSNLVFFICFLLKCEVNICIRLIYRKLCVFSILN